MSEGLCHSSNEYHGASNKLRAWRTEGCVSLEETILDGQKLWVLDEAVEPFALMGKVRHRKKEVRLEKILLLLLGFIEERSEGKELALLRHMDWVPFLDKVHSSPRFIFLEWVIVSCVEERQSLGEKSEKRIIVAEAKWFGATFFQDPVRTARGYRA